MNRQTSIGETCLRQLAEPQSSGETCVLDKYLQFLHDECKPASFYKMSNILSFKFQIV
jgi:hypothetical protein